MTTEPPPGEGGRWLPHSTGRAAVFATAGLAVFVVVAVTEFVAPRRQAAGANVAHTPSAAVPSSPTADPDLALPAPIGPSAREATSASNAVPFTEATARKALAAALPIASACRRGRSWGMLNATVTFANDGSVRNVAVARPFAGTETAACVADALGSAHMPPFLEPAGIMKYRFYVRPK